MEKQNNKTFRFAMVHRASLLVVKGLGALSQFFVCLLVQLLKGEGINTQILQKSSNIGFSHAFLIKKNCQQNTTNKTLILAIFNLLLPIYNLSVIPIFFNLQLKKTTTKNLPTHYTQPRTRDCGHAQVLCPSENLGTGLCRERCGYHGESTVSHSIHGYMCT